MHHRWVELYGPAAMKYHAKYETFFPESAWKCRLQHAAFSGLSVLSVAELILRLRPAKERRLYKVTPSLIGWAQT